MAKKSNPSPDTLSSRAKSTSASSKKENAVPKHRRTNSGVPEAAAVESAPTAVEETSEPLSASVSSHHPEVTPQVQVPALTITHEDVATLAFSYWERRGYQGGSPEEDWRRAEEELYSLLG
ncbi:MAG: DUF2934 domain-containing protein [Acidobacteriaceae bacterium]|nr:DUF2934 domain-containing protein [Acidobacteriaceae bacterium]